MAQKWFLFIQIKLTEPIVRLRKLNNHMIKSAKRERDRHKNIGLVELLKEEYTLTENNWELIEEATLYENDWALIGDLFYRRGLEQRMLVFFDELKEYSMQPFRENQNFNLSDKYPLEYLIALVTGCLETPSKLGGCDHSCGSD